MDDTLRPIDYSGYVPDDGAPDRPVTAEEAFEAGRALGWLEATAGYGLIVRAI